MRQPPQLQRNAGRSLPRGLHSSWRAAAIPTTPAAARHPNDAGSCEGIVPGARRAKRQSPRRDSAIPWNLGIANRWPYKISSVNRIPANGRAILENGWNQTACPAASGKRRVNSTSTKNRFFRLRKSQKRKNRGRRRAPHLQHSSRNYPPPNAFFSRDVSAVTF